MIWSRALVSLMAVISLLLGVIWPNNAAAASAPVIVPLGNVGAALSVPGKLDVDGFGNLYVADIRAQAVLKFDPSGDVVRSYDIVPATGRGLAVTADGSQLYVATNDFVAIVDGSTGAMIGQIAQAGAGAVDLDAAGNVYVVDIASVMVKVYDAAGHFLREFGGRGTANGQFRSIDTMSVNAATGEVYVAGMQQSPSEGGYATVQVFNADGAYSGRLVSIGGYVSECSGIAFDAADREYYLDKLTGKVHVRPRTTGFAPLVFNVSGSGNGQVVQPWDVAFDAMTNRLFVASDSGEVEVYGIDGGATPEKNIAPGQPALVSPVANGSVGTLLPQLRFANAVDVNGDTLTYDVQVSGTPSLRYSVAGGAGGETVVQVDQNLVENAVYSWQVLAKDAELDSGWTPAQQFYVNALEEAPSAPVLTTALAGESLGGGDLLSWQAAIDNDPLASVSYRVEISADDTFAAPVVSQRLDTTDVTLGALDNYLELVPGASYVWRVVAVDNSGLETASADLGRFRYETALLSVNANLPDARVYIGGNAAYSGAFVGMTPFESRDMVAGPYTVVVEHPGCETFVAQVEVGAVGSARVNANLLLAVEPVLNKASALNSLRSQLQSAALVAPFVVDFDNDDLADLLVGDENGSVNLFRALSRRGSKIHYGPAEALDFGQLPDTALFVVDWNNDNRKDVLVGAADGTVSLYPNTGSDTAPVFDSAMAVFLRDGNGTTIDVGSQANPAVIDFDGDNDKDLVVGTGTGKVLLFSNNGSDGKPELAVKPVELISFGTGSASPMFVDWDADGVRDLLVANGGSLIRCVRQADGAYAVAETLVDATDYGFADGARYFVVDADASQGKDVYVGLADGLVQIIHSSGKDFLPAVTPALLAKLDQVNELAETAAVDVFAESAAAAAGIESGDLGAAARAVKKIAATGRGDAALSAAALELQELLNQ